jgi:UDP-2,3-diacylglucosamine hydrolase
MRLLALSDLHVRGPDDPSYARLLQALSSAKPGDWVILAGDLFDLWLGAKPVFLERYSAFLEKLRELDRQGTKVHYLEGNHDFHLESVFSGMKNVQVGDDEVTLELGGRRLFFAHGDRIDSKDYGYRALRGFLRSLPFAVFVRWAPSAWIDAIGKGSSALSRTQHPPTLEDLPAPLRQRIRKLYREFAVAKAREGFDFIILGHCHDLDEKQFTVKGRPVQYLNMGYPPKHGSYLTWEVGEARFQRVPF